MTDRELMQQALEALDAYSWEQVQAATAALRERLAQPEQEPVAHLWQHSETGRTRIVMPDQIVTADATWHVVGPLYLTPPRREWVGLTLEEIFDCTAHITRIQKDDWVATDSDLAEFAHVIEAKIKEKNNG